MGFKEFGSTAKNAIYSEIRRSIILGHRAAGERLDIEALKELYQTSVTPVRDALQMLSQDGLVTIKPRSGYYVTRITLKELRDLLDLRKILEVAAIERAAIRITEEQIQELRQVHAGYTGDDDASYDRYTDENRRFHYLIAKASGNFELTHMIGRLHDRLARFMVIRRGGQSQEITHQKIIETLERNAIEAARNALLEDIDPSKEAILDKVLEKTAASWHLD